MEQAGDAVNEVGQVCGELGRKGDEVKAEINKFKGELVSELVKMIQNKDGKGTGAGKEKNLNALKSIKAKKKWGSVGFNQYKIISNVQYKKYWLN